MFCTFGGLKSSFVSRGRQVVRNCIGDPYNSVREWRLLARCPGGRGADTAGAAAGVRDTRALRRPPGNSCVARDDVLASLLVLSGIAAALGIVTLGGIQRHRRQVQTGPRTFRCALRSVSGDVDGLRPEFGQSSAYARWARDVLLVSNGVTLSRVRAFEVTTVGRQLSDVDARQAPGLGSYPLVMTAWLESGAVIEVAVARRDRARLLEPFVGPGAVHRMRRDPRMLEDVARLVKRAQRQSEERKEQELRR